MRVPGGGKDGRDVAPDTLRSVLRQAARFEVSLECTVVIEQADDGSCSVWVPDLPGRVSTGDTQDETLQMIREAIAVHVGLLREHGEPVPPPMSRATVVHAM